ncbi:MAG: 16S rRNA (cytosine(1402)-N(4))-methyltransferase RsmH [Erysipelotrichaceae bacterium]|nr:16S rRNA (cytosine(1402)-N(4))-methyltransferase RsmH [Erysipelotrichaceae bacterium]
MGFHYSVMLTETISLLDLKENGIYVDLTLGRGGTSSAILSRIPRGHLYSFDLDEEAITESQERLASVGTNFTILHANFRDFVSRLKEIGVKEVDGITADLGVSSPQFDEAERGFSYREDAPLDMRMNQESSVTAEQIVNQYSYEQLRDVFEKYGEDPYSKAIASAIVKEREKKPILTTGELVDLIKRVKPAKERMKKGHPAKQIFQALRIEVNQEMDNLKQMLDSFDSILKPGGRIAILTFQSLEDRMVKDKFRSLTVVEGSREGPDLLPEELPEAPYLALTRKPIVASEKELSENHRSKSAKLRAIQKKQK